MNAAGSREKRMDQEFTKEYITQEIDRPGSAL